MEPWLVLVLLPVGVVVGVLNVMAGGGSLLSMPILIFLGLDPAAANGTNRVAILAQNVVAVASFKSRGFSDVGRSVTLSVCTVPGAAAGAVAAVAVDPLVFKRLLGVVLVVSLILILRGRRRSAGADRPHLVWAHLATIGAGFYGGFMQAGVGFILMPILHRLLALDLVRVNMHKVFVVGAYTVPSLLIFAVTGKVWWLAGFVLAAGNAAGGWLGSRLTIGGGERAVRWVFAAAVVAMAARLVLA